MVIALLTRSLFVLPLPDIRGCCLLLLVAFVLNYTAARISGGAQFDVLHTGCLLVKHDIYRTSI